MFGYRLLANAEFV